MPYIHSYSFTVTATTDALAGQSASGQFSYATPDNPVHQHPDLGISVFTGFGLESFSLTWNGQSYDETDVLFGYAALYDDGALSTTYGQSSLGTLCFDGGCQYPGIGIGFDWFAYDPHDGLFRYGGSGFRGIGEGSMSYLGGYEQIDDVAAVPIPGALWLFVTALAMLKYCLPRREPHPRAQQPAHQ